MSSQVRQTCHYVMLAPKHVQINRERLQEFTQELASLQIKPTAWRDWYFHYTGPKILDYIFAIDTINFCFWPNDQYEYENLANNLKQMLEEDPSSLSPLALSQIEESTVLDKILEGKPLLLSERTRLLRELGSITLKYFEGSYANVLEKANGSAEHAVEVIAMYFPGFRDSAIYDGKQVFLYKRAQILVGDLHGAEACTFSDIEKLTMFPDYRVPQVLHSKGVLEYSTELHEKVLQKTEICPGSVEEVEIRAASVIVCDEIAQTLGVHSIQVDWLLWETGENAKDTLYPHHRTYTIFY